MADETGNGAGSTGEGGGSGTGDTVTLESVQAQLKTANEQLANNDGIIKGFKADMTKYKSEARILREAQEARQKKEADGSTDIDKIKADYQDIFKNKDATINDLTGKLRDRDVFGKIGSIAHKHGAINPDDVVTLIKGSITFDDKGDTIIAGGKVNEKTGKAYSLDDFTAEFLAGRQHLIKPSGNSGAGSTNSAGGGSGNQPQYTAAQLKAMSPDQYAEARKKNGGMIVSVK